MEVVKMSGCPNCKSSRTKTIHKDLKDKMHFVEGDFSILKCENCELEFLSPLLNEKELEKYYPSQGYYSFKENKIFTAYQKISAYYYSKKNVFANLLLSPLKPILHRYYNHNSCGKKILEIGCGRGLELEVYSKYGLITKGLEPYGPDLTERDRRLGIERKNVREARFQKDYFDFIIMREVLEHIPNQEEVMKKCYEWLKPEGKLIITVPNTKSLWRAVFKENWYGYDVPRHLYDYNPKSISIFLNKIGFKIEKIKVFDLPYMLYGSMQFSKADVTKKRKELPSFLKLLFTPVSLAVTLLNKGSIIEVECKK